jgi:hypothetical protein
MTQTFAKISTLVLIGALSACGGGGGGGSGSAPKRTLTVGTLGSGSVSSDVQPGILNCSGSTGTCSAQFKGGTIVKLTATPTAGNTFQAWVFPNLCAAGAAAPNECTVTMNQDRSQIATFQSNSVSGAGDAFALTANGRLISFDRLAPGTVKAPNATVTATPASDLTAASDLKGIAFRPSNGLLYGFSSDSNHVGKVFVIDPSTGAATRVATLSTATTGNEFGVRFNPITGNMVITSDSGQILEWTGAASGSNSSQDSAAGGPVNVTDVAFTNAFDQASVSTLYGLDTTASPQKLRTLTLPNTVSSSVSLGAPLTPENGFDVDAQNGVAYVASNPVANTPNLYTLNLTSGVLSSVGGIGGGENVRGLALPQPKRPEVFAIYESSATPPPAPNANNVCGTCVQGRSLVKFSPNSPGSYTVVGEVTLPASATVLALAVRPSNNALVALGSDGTLYKIDPLSGAPSSPHLISGSGVTIDPAQFYGMAFDPATDKIRLVGRTDDGQVGTFDVNYVIDADTGVGTKEAVLQKPPFKISGMAYNNDTGNAVVYAIDYQNSRLFTLDNTPPPFNSGSISLVANLSIAPAGTVVNGFEIDGGGNAYAVWNVSSTPHLFSIGLNNGGVVDSGAIGTASIASITKGTNSNIVAVTGGTTPHQISFSPNTPGSVADAGAITGLAEKVVAIDVQPGSGTLYAVGLSGKIYTIAATIGGPVATSTVSLTNAPGNNATGAYDMTLATNYDMDFDPNTPTQFRLVDDSGRNVLVIANTGVASEQGDLDQSPDPFVSSAAYTHNYAGSSDSILLVLDANGDLIQRVTPPSSGLLFDVGDLDGSVNATKNSRAGMDIVGGQDGLALLAVVLANLPGQPDDAFTTVYSFDPATGQLRNGGNAVGTVGIASSPSHPADTEIIVDDIAIRFPD